MKMWKSKSWQLEVTGVDGNVQLFGVNIFDSQLALAICGLIKTIKNCIMFFTVLTIIGMVAYFFILMNQ